MGRTANSLVRERTFYVKVRNYVHYTHPNGFWPAPQYHSQGTSPGQTMQLAMMFDRGSQDGEGGWGGYDSSDYGNKWFGTLDFKKKIRDIHDEYGNVPFEGIWTVSSTGKWKVDISNKVQMAITLGVGGSFGHQIEIPNSGYLKNNGNRELWNYDEVCKVNAAVIGTIHLCKLPNGNTESIRKSDVFAQSSLTYNSLFNKGNASEQDGNPYLNIPGVQILDTQHLMIQYNQNGNSGGSNHQPYWQSDGGNGSITQVPLHSSSQAGTYDSGDNFGFNWTWDGVSSRTAVPTWQGSGGNTNPTWPTISDLRGQNKSAFEYRDGGHQSWYSVDSAGHGENKINSSGWQNPHGNEYKLGLNQTQFDKGDRVFVVIGYQYCTYDPTLPIGGLGGSMPSGFGKSIYQWDGGSHKNRSFGSTAIVTNNSGEFIAKKVM